MSSNTNITYIKAPKLNAHNIQILGKLLHSSKELKISSLDTIQMNRANDSIYEQLKHASADQGIFQRGVGFHH
jgi:hypothetical protein